MHALMQCFIFAHGSFEAIAINTAIVQMGFGSLA